MIAAATATDTIGEGIVLGLVAGVGFAIAISIVTATFESNKPKPMVWGAVNAGYHLVGNLVAAIIIAAIQCRERARGTAGKAAAAAFARRG